MTNHDCTNCTNTTHTSLLPRPKPLTTGPLSLRGKGWTGPESGPAVRGRGSEGLIGNDDGY